MSQLAPDANPWLIPCAEPPPGVISNFYKQSPLMSLTIGVVVTVFSLMTVASTLRFGTKYKNHETWRLDDLFVVATYVLSLTFGAMQFPQTAKFGFEAWDVPLGLLLTKWTRNMLATNSSLGQVMLFFGKCCILTFYFRMFGHMARIRMQIYATLLLASPLLVASILMPLWVGPPAYNVGTARLTLAIGIIKLAVDLVIVYMPIPVVLGMNLSRRKKVGVLATFLTGSIAIIADIVDLYFRIQMYRGATRPFIYGIYITLCSLTEAGISVIVASMPAAAKVWKRHVVGSSLYNFVRSRFPASITPTLHIIPSDLQAAKAKAQKKRRWGLYSIPTLLTSRHAVAQNEATGHVGAAVLTKTEMTMVREFRRSLEQKFASLNGSSLELRDPLGLEAGRSTT
ncbi:hypothetical protein DE146DRAFT_408178 [Phaeosphaeria sp. MPI-PUGE-AT-0046c]|nr:hypothetical protein DE146DRAFT_408178 [Phaeosphaeria sp. MPI-PUGE-AT-0046c]